MDEASTFRNPQLYGPHAHFSEEGASICSSQVQHLDALMKEVIIPQDIEKLGLQRPQLSAIRPPRQFRRCTTPPLAMDSYSSNQEMTAEEAEDTAACPHTATVCRRRDSPQP